MIEITIFTKANGVLSKRIELVAGKPVSDGSACFMVAGRARRAWVRDAQTFADCINSMTPSDAYVPGRIKDGFADDVKVVTTDKLNGPTALDVIARSRAFMEFKEGAPGVALLDIDFKGCSDGTRKNIDEAGGPEGVLFDVLPALESAAVVSRESTSSGLSNPKTGEFFKGSGGSHLAVFVADASDIPRFVSDLFDRLVLAGYGWGWIDAAGRFHERGLIDRAVATPEHLVFEGPPIVIPPLEQAPRPARGQEGDIIDAYASCPPLTDAEREAVRRFWHAERARLKPEADLTRAHWQATHISLLIKAGKTPAEAKAITDRWIDTQELSGDFPLPFGDPKLAGATVAEVLANPTRYNGKTLADPIEGPSYGKGKARVYVNGDGSVVINSFAHSGTVYKLVSAPFAAPKADNLLDPWCSFCAPNFPIDILPEGLGEYVSRLSEAMAADRSAIAMAMLTACSGAIDHRFKVRMKRRSEWREHVRLWTLIIGDSATKKTPIINEATQPLSLRDAAAMRAYGDAKTAFDARMKGVKRTDRETEPPRPELLMISDLTTERLTEALSRSERGALAKHDELAGWLGLLERYHGGGGYDRQVYLEAWNGGPRACQRKSGDVYVRNLSLSFLAGVQPKKLAEIHGLTSDGCCSGFSRCWRKELSGSALT